MVGEGTRDPFLSRTITVESTSSGQTRLQNILLLNRKCPEMTDVNYVQKEGKLTERLLYWPIKIIFRLLATRIYHKNLVAMDLAAFKRRIRHWIYSINIASVQSNMRAVPKKLLWVYGKRLLEVCLRWFVCRKVYFNSVYHWFNHKHKISIRCRVAKLFSFFSYHPLLMFYQL